MKLYAFALALVAAGNSPAQKPFQQTHEPDVVPPAKLRANRNSYSAIVEVLKASRPAVPASQVEKLRELQFENIWKALGPYQNGYARGFKGTRPRARLMGRALTIRMLPTRPDVGKALATLATEGDWAGGVYQRAAEDARPGDVIVVEAGGEHGSVFMGDMSALGMKMSGAAGVLIDGLCRDLAELQTDAFKDFPVFARTYDVHGATWAGTEWNVPIRIGGVTVLPGDIVVAEEEGVLFFPPEMLEAVIHKASEAESMESFERGLILQKKYRFRDIYPPAPELLKQYESQTKSANR